MHDIDDSDEFDLDHNDAFGDFGDDPFDEQTFQLEINVADPKRRELARYIQPMLMRLTSLRMSEEASFFDAWKHTFDRDYLRADIEGSDPIRAVIARNVEDALIALSEMRVARRHLLPILQRMHGSEVSNTNTSTTNGVRSAV